MADIPGIIEGAAEGVGLGIDFLRHIERTRVLLHVVDAASVEGRDPLEDIDAINAELRSYSVQLAERPTIIVANKLDVLPPEDREAVLKKLKDKFEPEIPVYPISAATGEGIRELLNAAYEMIQTAPDDVMEFTPEITHEEYNSRVEQLPYTVEKSKDEEGLYIVEGPRIERMLGYTNLEDDKGFKFFQDFMKDNGIIDELKALGIQEGDTVRVYGWAFEYLE
jgi:GTP-binding protein